MSDNAVVIFNFGYPLPPLKLRAHGALPPLLGAAW